MPYVLPVYQTIVEYPVKSVLAGVVAAVSTAGTTNVLKSIVSFCRRPGNNLSDAEGSALTSVVSTLFAL